MERPFITLISDFGQGRKSVGIMKAIAMKIAKDARVIDISHDIQPFDLIHGAKTLEACYSVPVGFHVCVVDPGVGTKRKAIIIKTKRGDHLVGPDNGVLLPAAERFFGGIVKAVEITNDKYMNKPVSPIFHGRDVFAPAAAHLSNGVDISAFGPKINPKKLVKAPYAEADIKKTRITAMALSINRFGNVFLNIIFNEMKKKSGIRLNDNIKIMTSAHDIDAKFVKAFGEVGKNEPAMMPDDFGRIELAINQGDFADRYGVRQGERIDILKS